MKIDWNANIELNKALQRLGKETEIQYAFTKEDIKIIHTHMIEDFGGMDGIRDFGLLDSISKSPYQEIFEIEVFPEIYDKAAKYLFDFAHYQVFMDGNKRTGLAVANYFFMENGYQLTMSAEEQYFLVMDIANNKFLNVDDISIILKNNLKFYTMDAILENEKDDDYEKDE